MEHARLVHSLTDDELLRRVTVLTAESRRGESELVAHLAEVDARKLFARESCATMFGYCTTVLHLSESEAFLRIRAARASRRHPLILTMLGDGRLHLSGIAILVPHLTIDNAAAVLERATHKTKRQVAELIAALAPQPDVPPVIRKLPAMVGAPADRTLATTTSVPSGVGAGAASGVEVGDRRRVGVGTDFALRPDTVTPSPPPLSFASAVPTAHVRPRTPNAATVVQPRASNSAPVVQALSPDRYKVQFTASASLKAKLERLQALMPGRDLADALEVAVTEKLDRIEARRFGKTKAPRIVTRSIAKASAAAAPTPGRMGGSSNSIASGQTTIASAAATTGAWPETMTGSSPETSVGAPRDAIHPPAVAQPITAAGSRYIPASVRRAVCERDGDRCRFVNREGQRCAERNNLEFHHRHPYALGGGNDTGNIRLMCRTHNAYLAEADYGRPAMAKFRRLEKQIGGAT